MKKILYLFAGLVAGIVTVRGQGLLKAGDLPQQKLHLSAPPVVTLNGLLGPDTTRALVMTPGRQIRNLMPDHMPCLVADLARPERMPMLRSTNKDPMPNGFHSNRPQPFYLKPVEK
jgi:hypothetical protein